MPRSDPEQYGLGALYRLYGTDDGWVFLAAPQPASGRRSPSRSNIPNGSTTRGSPTRPRCRARRRASELLSGALRSRTAAEWEKLLTDAGVGCSHVFSGEHSAFTATDTVLRDTGLVAEIEHPTLGRLVRHGAPVQFSETPGRIAPGAFAGNIRRRSSPSSATRMTRSGNCSPTRWCSDPTPETGAAGDSGADPQRRVRLEVEHRGTQPAEQRGDDVRLDEQRDGPQEEPVDDAAAVLGPGVVERRRAPHRGRAARRDSARGGRAPRSRVGGLERRRDVVPDVDAPVPVLDALPVEEPGPTGASRKMLPTCASPWIDVQPGPGARAASVRIASISRGVSRISGGMPTPFGPSKFLIDLAAPRTSRGIPTRG